MKISSATPLISPSALGPGQAPQGLVGARAPELPPLTAPEAAGMPTQGAPALEAEIERANQRLQGSGNIQFAMHDNRVVVRIVDPASSEIIREFPNTDLLDMVSKLQELSGIAVDETV